MNMLGAATSDPRDEIEYRPAFVEELELPDTQFDLVVSSLAFHYVDDLKSVIEKIHGWMKPSGTLVFSIEHPITTAILGQRPGWINDDKGERIGWDVTDYSSEGERISD